MGRGRVWLLFIVLGLGLGVGLGPAIVGQFSFTAGAQGEPTPTPLVLPINASVRLKTGKDADLVAATCAKCHTLLPIVRHDGLSKEMWAQEVQKMRQENGAQIDDATAARIVTYLQTYYSSPPPSTADFLIGATPVSSPAATPAK